MQHASGMLRQPVQKLVATMICFEETNVTTPLGHHPNGVACLLGENKRGVERSNAACRRHAAATSSKTGCNHNLCRMAQMYRIPSAPPEKDCYLYIGSNPFSISSTTAINIIPD